jgi:preprotein translocase subunit SecF
MEVLIMAIEAISGAGMTYQGSASTAEIKTETQPKVEASEQIQASEEIAKNTSALNTKETGDSDGGSQNQAAQDGSAQRKEQIKKAVDEINKKASGAKLRPRGVGDAQTVEIPSPTMRSKADTSVERNRGVGCPRLPRTGE